MKRKRDVKILLVEPDAGILEMVVSALERRLDARITCVADAEACLDIAAVERHDVIVSEQELPTCDGLRLAEYVSALGAGPIILLMDDPTPEQVVEAMRSGVRDVFLKPFPVASLMDAIERVLHGSEIRRLHALKYRRMRDLVRRVIRERRDLNRRMELICKDLVGAHRRLVTRVVQSESARAAQAS